MNKVIFMGRLVADPEFSTAQNGTAICKFRIAVDRAFQKNGEKQSDFFQITGFGSTAEFVSKYFPKGKPILIEGRIQNNNYTDRDGVQHYQDQIIADKVSFLLSDTTKSGNQPPAQNPQNNGYQGGYNQQYVPPAQNPQNNFTEYGQISDSELPF